MDKAIIVATVVVGQLQTNCYILGCSKRKDAVLIDPGDDVDKIRAVVKEKGLKLKSIILTHGHYDHIGALDSFDLPIFIHADDAQMLLDSTKNLSANFGLGREFSKDNLLINTLKDDDMILVGDLKVRVLHTPGHSPGGICLEVGDVLFSGDTLFYRGIGRTDLPGGSYEVLVDSINKKIMASLDGKTQVFPGHGPSTTIAEERKENGFL